VDPTISARRRAYSRPSIGPPPAAKVVSLATGSLRHGRRERHPAREGRCRPTQRVPGRIDPDAADDVHAIVPRAATHSSPNHAPAPWAERGDRNPGRRTGFALALALEIRTFRDSSRISTTPKGKDTGVAGSGAEAGGTPLVGSAPDALASALGLPCGQPQPPKHLSP